jgi:hypothetical protein
VVQHCERMAGSVLVGQASVDAPASRFHLPTAIIAERGFCVDADHLLPDDYLAAQFMDRIAYRRPQIIGCPGMGGADVLIGTPTRLGDISAERRVVTEAEGIVQTAETTASYSRT